jgi:hypothetical protein
MIDTFSLAHDSATGQITATTFAILDILRICMKRLPLSTFVLDEIDECSDNEELLERHATLQLRLVIIRSFGSEGLSHKADSRKRSDVLLAWTSRFA